MCALFYDYNVQLPANHRHVSASWGEQDPVLAVGLENREIHFFTDEGEKVPNAAIYSRAADIVLSVSQPRGKALAVGWSDGMISLWIHKDSASREVNSPHVGRITLLRWAPSGNRLISADENGVLAVWKVDGRCQLSLATTYTRKGSLTQLALATTPAQQRSKGESLASSQPLVCPSFFFGGEIGSVHYADDLGHISDIETLNHAVDAVLFHEELNRLIVITRSHQLNVFQVHPIDGTVKLATRFKLSIQADGSLREAKWAGSGIIAIASGEPLVRFWDLQAEENSVLSLPPMPETGTKHHVMAIDFSPRRRILAAGTNQGAVFFWRSTSVVVTSTDASPASKNAVMLSYRWDLIYMSDVTAAAIMRVGWSNTLPTLYASNTDGGVLLFHEGSMQCSLCGDTAVIQSRPTVLSIEKYQDGTVTQSTVEAKLRIKGVSHDGLSLVAWNGSKAEVFELRSEQSNDPKRVAQFNSTSTAMVLRGDSIYRAMGNHVEICNMQGVVKKSISFTEAEGKPALLAVQHKFLAVATDRGLLRVFDLKSRDPKAIGSMGNFTEAFNGETKQSSMRAIAINADGTRVAILADRVEGTLKIRTPLSKLYLFQSDLSIFQQFDFGVNKYPTAVFFDPVEPRLMACESFKTKPDTMSAASKAAKAEGGGDGSSTLSDKEVTVFFASNDHGILMQNTFDLDVKYSGLLGIQVPRIYLVANDKANEPARQDKTRVYHVGGAKGADLAREEKTAEPAKQEPASLLRTRVMRDFVGLDKVNEAARQALIDFCYFMTVGNMDEAYRSVKLIDNPSVWENMAHMCVKTKRLDVAEVCLGNMGHARGAAAVQEAKKEPQLEVAIAMVAIQLGMLDEAADLYRQCGRYDLLNKLYQSSGLWQKAVGVASKRDRMHLKTTHHQLAQHYEALGNIKEAMEAYEDAGTHVKDIPRMLFKLGKLELLQKYISTSKDRDLLIWWAQFQESQGHFDAAIESYQRAKDDLSVVRVLCFKKDLQTAAKVVEASHGNRAAAYHLARQWEAMGEITKAIQCYALGNCYSHTIRLAKEHHLDAELMSYALMSKASDMLDCAAYFEARGEMDKAVQLYHKGGNVGHAIELCFKAQLFEELHYLTDELGPTNTPPSMLKRCADFFIENGHYAKAVHLLLVAGRNSEALDVCLQHKVKVTEDMAEKMTPPKDDAGDDKAGQRKRTELLLKLAKCCKQQGAYHLATKKYTQAGEKIKAMKCLLKSGDTEKVVFFANVSRNNDIYVLAANYLQTLDWRKDGETLKNIVGFYTKARAFEQLSAFYQACAQAEMEDYRDYDKAMGALQEAAKALAKGKSSDKERLMKALETKTLLVEQFVTVRQQLRGQQQNASEMVAVLGKLLEEPGIDEAIRVGDAYALMVEAHYQDGDYREAYAVLQTMKSKGIVAKSYVEPRVLQDVQQKAGVVEDSGKRRESKPSPRGDDDDEGRQEAKISGSGGSGGARKVGKAPSREEEDEEDMEEEIAEDAD